jgi:hypothetical protein
MVSINHVMSVRLQARLLTPTGLKCATDVVHNILRRAINRSSHCLVPSGAFSEDMIFYRYGGEKTISGSTSS